MILFSASILRKYFIFVLLIVFYSSIFSYTTASLYYIISYLIGCYPFVVILHNLKNNFLKWFDPLIIGYFVLFQIYFLTFFYIIKEPSALDVLSFGGDAFNYMELDEKFYYIFNAQLILSIFSFILLVTNSKKVSLKSNLKKNISKADVLFSRLIIIIVVFSLFNLFKNFKFLILNLGTVEVEAQSGEGFISILSRGGLFFAPFAILSLRKNIKFSFFFLITVLISLLEIPGGSRSAVLYFVVFSVFYFGMKNDFKIKKKDMILPGSILLFILIVMSIIRNFNSSSISIDNNLTSFDNISEMWDEDENNSNIFVAADRVRPIALMLRYVEGLDYSYTYGETLLARPLKTINIINRKLGIPEFQFKTADEYTHLSRFGNIVNEKGNWAVPLSVAGEFYLQFGYISLFLLSFFFGKAICWGRINLNKKKSNFTLSVTFLLALYAMKTVESELMFYSVLIIFILPIFSMLHKFSRIKS